MPLFFMKVSDLIIDIGFKLGDVRNQVYTTVRLHRLLDKAFRDIATRTRLFYAEIHITILDNETLMVMPENFFNLVRVEDVKGNVIPFKTLEEMDREKKEWSQDIGDKITAIVYTQNNIRNFIIYPKVKNTKDKSIKTNSNYGMITSFNSTNINYKEVNIERYGMLDVQENSTLKITYNKRLEDITNDNTMLDIDRQIGDLAVLFVTSEALKDNTSSQNIEISKTIRFEYEALLAQYQSDTRRTNYVERDRNSVDISLNDFP